MQKMKKFLSVLLCVAMLLSSVPMAFAAGETTGNLLAQFTFGEKGDAAHVDGNEMKAGTGDTYTDNGYTIAFTGLSKVYYGGKDATGIPFVKFGTSSVVGTLTFEVPAEVESVVLKLSGYKAKTSKYIINDGAAVTLTAKSDDGAYEDVVVDTSANKTVTVATVSGATRMVMSEVLFYGKGGASSEPVVTEPVVTEPIATEPVVTEPVATEPADPDGTELTIEKAIAMALAMEHNVYTETKYSVTGVITEVYNTVYGNMKITDDAGNILTIYGTYDAEGKTRYDAMEVKPVAGDTVTIYGAVGHYNGTPQIKNGWVVAHTVADPDATQPTEPEVEEPADGTELTIEQAIAMGTAKAHNTYTTNKFNVTGEITEVYNTTYGNMYIKDAAGNILTIYGTYDADGTNRYDAMATKPVAGDTVTIYGAVGQYNGTAQIKNGWIVAHIPAEPGATEPEATEPVATEPVATEPVAPSDATYVKINSADEFTRGTYVMMVDTGYAMGALDDTWISFVQPKVSGDTVVDAAGGVWTLTVDGATVKITDANGVTIAPKGANTNGIASGDYSWSWAVENGVFTFVAEAEAVQLASNAQADKDWTNKFRAYKLTTLTGGYAADYHAGYELYKLAEVTEPTEPEATEPSVEPTQPTEPSVEPTVPEDTQPTEPSVEPTVPPVEPTEPEATEPTAPVIPEGSTVINVTLDKAEIYRGDEVTVTVSLTGDNVWSSMGYIPLISSEYFTVISGEALMSGMLVEFTATDGGVILLNSANAATGDAFRFTIKIAEDAPFGAFTLTDVASTKNGQVEVPTFVLETGAKVLCRHEVTFTSLGQEKHSGVCSICNETVTEEHTYVNGKCEACGELKDYVVIFQYEDGTIISQATYHYGDAVTVPEAPAVPEAIADTHEFDGWDKEIVAVDGDATYTAQFKMKYIRGDVNGDLSVNDADAMYLLRYTLFGDIRYPINQPGDMNGDGLVNDTDAMYLLRYTLFGDTRYPLANG